MYGEIQEVLPFWRRSLTDKCRCLFAAGAVPALSAYDDHLSFPEHSCEHPSYDQCAHPVTKTHQ